MDIRSLSPWFDSPSQQWAIEARLLRWLTFLWLFIGLVALFSASYPIAETESGDGLYYVKRQLLSVLFGSVGFTILIRFPLRYALSIANWAVLFLLGLIVATLIPGVGTTINGATRWLFLGSFPLQPSELIKPFLVLQSARLFSQWDRLTVKHRVKWLLIFAAVLVGILLQPNLSTAAFCGMTLFLVALAAGLPYLYLGGTAIAGFLLASLSVTINEYQRRRILSFLNPWADPGQDGYQLIQSLLAIGSGGFWGAGLGMSQQKLFYLPIQYTDFIFAVYAEEFGLVGSWLFMLLLGAYATLGLLVALKARRLIYQLVAIGATTLMVGQALINIGVTTGVLPTTGLPLPLFSYGGNSMIASLLAAGLLIRVARENHEADVVSLEHHRRKTRNSNRPTPPPPQRLRKPQQPRG
ncbi:MAG: FtsW/RodA/SpoVE family cell cycle protein [Desertifilum sp.]|nr:FtsW/RodA/SpoVE family cell cycle protein [Desertifilum sp.]